jgi:hypothetical protein
MCMTQIRSSVIFIYYVYDTFDWTQFRCIKCVVLYFFLYYSTQKKIITGRVYVHIYVYMYIMWTYSQMYFIVCVSIFKHTYYVIAVMFMWLNMCSCIFPCIMSSYVYRYIIPLNVFVYVSLPFAHYKFRYSRCSI